MNGKRSQDTRTPAGTTPREYPHGSGDRNTKSPLHPDDDKTFDGGAQRNAPPDGEVTKDAE